MLLAIDSRVCPGFGSGDGGANDVLWVLGANDALWILGAAAGAGSANGSGPTTVLTSLSGRSPRTTGSAKGSAPSTASALQLACPEPAAGTTTLADVARLTTVSRRLGRGAGSLGLGAGLIGTPPAEDVDAMLGNSSERLPGAYAICMGGARWIGGSTGGTALRTGSGGGESAASIEKGGESGTSEGERCGAYDSKVIPPPM